MRRLFLPSAVTDQLGRFARITLKELREILRDRRTILTLLLMPLLIYPLLSVAFQQFMLASARPEGRPTYKIAFIDQEELALFSVCLINGFELTPPRRPPADSPAAKLKVLADGPRIQPEINANAMSLLRNGNVDLFVRLRQPERWREALRFRPQPDGQPGFEFDPERGVKLDCEIAYVHGSWYGEQALDYVERLVMASNARFLHIRLTRARVPDPGRPDAVHLVLEPQTPEGVATSFSLKAFIPLILILMTITGAVYPAIDLTAGERERGTLDVLIAAPVPRLGLLFAKYVAVLTVAMLTAVTNLVMMTLTLSFSGLGVQVFEGGLTVGTVVLVLLLLLLFAAFFSALLLVLSSFARSFKEAQVYIVPLVLLTLAPGMITLLPNISLDGLLTVAPLVNMVLLTRDLFDHKAEALPAAVVVLSTLLYAAAALALAARIFGAEAVLYSEQSGWSELFRRPSEPQPAAGVVTALVCLAVMFPLTYLLTNLVKPPPADQLVDPEGLPHDLAVKRLLLMVAINVSIFLGVPALAAWLGRVRLGTGFRLRFPPWLALPGALLLGVGLWVFAHEGLLLLQQLGVLRPVGFEPSREWARRLLQQWRELPPAVVVLTVGVLVPIVEELFFRGYLFAALRASVASPNPRKGPSGIVTTIGGSALLFGLFHLVTVPVLGLERFLGSTLMGLVLGWVCWRTGSVVPGMVLHACHNTILVLIGLYAAQVTELGWNVEEDHAPMLWLVAATVAVVAGTVLVAAGRPATIRAASAEIQ